MNDFDVLAVGHFGKEVTRCAGCVKLLWWDLSDAIIVSRARVFARWYVVSDFVCRFKHFALVFAQVEVLDRSPVMLELNLGVVEGRSDGIMADCGVRLCRDFLSWNGCWHWFWDVNQVIMNGCVVLFSASII